MSDSPALPVPDLTPAHSDEPAYQRLTQDDIAKILRLRDEQLTLVQIADLIGVTHSTISRVLSKFRDTSDLALLRLKASAQRSAERVIDIVETGPTEEALKAAKVVLAASGVTERVSNVHVGVQVVIGTPGQPAVNAQVVTVQTVNVTPAQAEKSQ